MKMLFGSIGTPISVLCVCVRVFIAIIIGSIIGFERERKNRPAGLRTHVLVCMAASLIAIVEQQMIYEVSTLASGSINLSFGRLSVGVITGIGFIGAGTIMMSKSKIVGLTTAASLWCTACLGLINGMGFSIVSLVSAIVVIVVLQVLRMGERTNLNRIIEVEFLDQNNEAKEIEKLLIDMNINIHDYAVSFYKEDKNKYCVTRYSIIFRDREEIINTMTKLSNIENVREVKIQNVL